MQDANVNFVHGVPTHFVRLLSYLEQNEEFRLQIEQLKAIGLVSGAACSPQVIRKVRNELGIKLCNHYGLAEFGGVSVVALDEQDSETIYESVGKPFDWVRLAIVDASIEPVSQGTVGEVLLQGPGLMKAYYGQHKETRKKITSDGWLRTADLGMLDKNGNLRLVGRSSDMIIRCGNNVYPIEIETTLREHPQVFDAVAFGLPDIELGESICACIVPRGELDASAIFEFLRG
jgi:acyl-CoA synthetase (AMP-forming)/AMP-acid ligase II